MNQFLAATQNINDIPCGGAEVLRTIKFAMTMIDIICFIIPIILILIITVGFAKNVIANNVDDMKKEFILIVKKIIMCVGIFFIPLIVRTVNIMLGDLGVDYSKCITLSQQNDFSQYEIKYPEIENNQDVNLSNGKTTAIPGESKTDDSKSTNIKETDLNVFIGDSRFKGMSDAVNKSSTDIWISEVGAGYTWFSTKALNELKNKVDNNKTYNIFINMGVNDLGNKESYAKKYAELASTYSSSNIIIVSVNPVDENAEKKSGYKVKNSEITEFNNTVKKAEGVTYCDTNSKIKSSFKTNDGIHYTNDTYKKIYEEMKKCTIGNNSNTSPAEKVKSSNTGTSNPQSTTYKIIFIGNSKTAVQNIPKKVQKMAENGGYKVNITSATEASRSLIWLAKNKKSTIKKSYDIAVLQDKTDNVESNLTKYKEGAKNVSSLLKEGNKNVKIYLRQTWGYKENRNNAKKHKAVQQNATKVSKEIGATIIPDGLAWDTFYNKYPNLELYSDERHQNPTGAYLTAACIYKSILGGNPLQLTYYGDLSEEEAKRTQDIANTIC